MLRVGRPRLLPFVPTAFRPRFFPCFAVPAMATAMILGGAGGSVATAGLWPPSASPPELHESGSVAPTRSAGEIRRLVRAGREDVLTWCAALLDSPTPAARALGLEGWRLAPSLPASVRRQVERTLGDDDPSTRLLALEVLARHDLRPSWAVFTALLEDPSREVRLSAVRALGETGEPKAMLVLMGARHDLDRDVRAAVYTAMGQTGEARAVMFLRPALDDRDGRIRRAAAQALAALGDTTIVTRLEAWALPSRRDEPADRDAQTALLALGQIATDEALRFLTALLREPPHHPALLEGLRQAGARAFPFLEREATLGPPDAAVAALRLLAEDRSACAEPSAAWLEREPAIALTALDLWRRCLTNLGTGTTNHVREARFIEELLAREPRLRSPRVRSALLTWLAEAEAPPGDSVRAERNGETRLPLSSLSPARLAALLGGPDAEVRAAALRLAVGDPRLHEPARRNVAWARALDGTSVGETTAALALLRTAPRPGDVGLLLAHPPTPRTVGAWAASLDTLATPDDLPALDAAFLATASPTMTEGLLLVEARLNRLRRLDGTRRQALTRVLGALVDTRAPQDEARGEAWATHAERAAHALAWPELPPSLTRWAAAVLGEAAPTTRAALAAPLRDAWARGRLAEPALRPWPAAALSRRLRLWEKDGEALVPVRYAIVPAPCGEPASDAQDARTDGDGVLWCDDLAADAPTLSSGPVHLDRSALPERLSPLDRNGPPP